MSDERNEIAEELDDIEEIDEEKSSWFKKFIKVFLKTKAGAITCLVLIGAILLTVVGIALYKPEQTLDTSYIIARLEESSELTTAKLHYTGMSEFKDSGIVFINRSDFIMVYEATARAGIDVKEIKVEADKLTRTVWLTIPEAKILDVKVDSGSIKYFDEKFSLFNLDEKDDANKATALAEEKAKLELAEMGILEMANQQAEALIKGLIQDLIPAKYELKVK